MKTTKVLSALGLLAATSSTYAADVPTLGSILEASGIAVTGHVSASYYHSDARDSYHNFDTEHDTFQLDQAALTVAYQPKEGFGALAQLIGGEDATVLSTTRPTNGNPFTGSQVAFAQAYLQYVKGPVTILAGKFPTLAGSEVVTVTGNTQYTRSFLFFNQPFFHSGIRAIVAANDMFTVTLGVNNGWNYDRVFSDMNGAANTSAKTIEAGISVVPSKKLSLSAVVYSGKDPILDATRTMIDVVGTFYATDRLWFALNYDNVKQDQLGGPSQKWDGVALYANYLLTDQWRLSLRLEQFNDKDGFITGTADEKLKEATVTVAYLPTKQFELRGEVRQDKSDKSTFIDTADRATIDALGPDNLPTTDKQTEFALQGIFKF